MTIGDLIFNKINETSSVKEVAEKLGVGIQVIYDLKGTKSIGTERLIKISKILNVGIYTWFIDIDKENGLYPIDDLNKTIEKQKEKIDDLFELYKIKQQQENIYKAKIKAYEYDLKMNKIRK